MAALLVCAVPACAQIIAQPNAGLVVYRNSYDPHPPLSLANVAISLPAHETEKDKLESLVRRLARQHQLDPRFVEAVIRVESDWNPSAVSPQGAEGIMQLLPATAERFGLRDAFDPVQNVRAGVTYLGDLVKRFGGNLRDALAAYYAGEDAVERAGGVPASPQIAGYVRQVLNAYFQTGSLKQPVAAGPNPIHEAVDGRGRSIFTNQ